MEELDKLRHADGNVTVAELRLELQKVSKALKYLPASGHARGTRFVKD